MVTGGGGVVMEGAGVVGAGVVVGGVVVVDGAVVVVEAGVPIGGSLFDKAVVGGGVVPSGHRLGSETFSPVEHIIL